MLIDALVSFLAPGSNLSIVAAAGVGTPSNTVDLYGFGVGVPATGSGGNIIGQAPVIGGDAGIGQNRPEINVVVGTTLTTANGATLNVALQAAVDNGTGNPGSWNILAETGPIAAANLSSGQIIARFPFLPAFPANLRPRFLRLLFQVPAATNFTAGTISSAAVTMCRDDTANKFAYRNYAV